MLSLYNRKRKRKKENPTTGSGTSLSMYMYLDKNPSCICTFKTVIHNIIRNKTLCGMHLPVIFCLM